MYSERKLSSGLTKDAKISSTDPFEKNLFMLSIL